MKKYRKYILLVAFIALFSFNNVQAYTPKCDLDASKKMDWAISQFENEIIPWENLSGLQKSSVSGIDSNGNPDTTKSLFQKYYKLAPQLYYDDSYGCGYETPRQGEEQGQSASDKTLVLEILHKGSIIKTINTVPKSEIIYLTSDNTYIPNTQKIFLADICDIWDTSNASNIKNCSIQFRAKDKNGNPKVSDFFEIQYTKHINSNTEDINNDDYIEIQPKYFFKEPPAEASDSCNLTADDIWFGSGNVDLKNPVLTGKDISLHIDTAGRCDGQDISILLREADATGVTANSIDFSNSKSKIRLETTPYKNTIINFIGGEDDCEEHSDWNQTSGTINWFHNLGITDDGIINDLDDIDCQIYVNVYEGHIEEAATGDLVGEVFGLVYDGFTKITSTYPKILSNYYNSLRYYYPINFKEGVIGGECDGKCTSGKDWKIKNIVGAKAPFNQSLEVVNSQQNFDSKSPCFENGKYLENCYEFLAPLDGIEKNAEGDLQENFKVSGNRIAILDVRKYELGDYVNKIFQMAISILGILAVIMIIIAGIQYMTVESIYGKSDAKQRIIGAVTGLMLSVGIFVILNTINPQLLQINFGSNLDTVSVDGGGQGLSLTNSPNTGSRSLDPKWAMANAPKLQFINPTSLVSACDENNFESYSAFGKTVRTRKELKETIQRISIKWSAMGSSKYPIKSIDGYNCRLIKPGGDISTHSYGITLDINPEKNPYIKTKPSSGWGNRSTYTDMPESFVKLFTEEGFGWGGNWNNMKDAMHFSKEASREQGTQNFKGK